VAAGSLAPSPARLANRGRTQDTQRRKIIGPTKTGRSRAVPLGERAMRALKRHKVPQAKWKLLIGEEYKDQGLIFASGTGGILQAENYRTGCSANC